MLGKRITIAIFATSVTLAPLFGSAQQNNGVTATSVTLGAVMDLEGDSSALGRNMKAGMEAAFKDQTVQGRSINLIAENDFYDPPRTVAATRKLIAEGIFAMIGNVGTPTARVALPILARNGVPAIGFFTGAGLLRPGTGDIINYRASYVQETKAVIDAAFRAGIQPKEICAYVQNDAYGMAGVAGIKAAFAATPDNDQLIALLDQITALQGDQPERNKIGPVGVYSRNTLRSKEGYDSLKFWELISGVRCRLVVTIGTYTAVGRFIAYARQKNEYWLFSAVSFTGAQNLRGILADYGFSDGLIVTQVVPNLDSSLPIVNEARAILGESLNYVSLEGFIVGRMFISIMENVEGPLTRRNFLAAARGKVFNLGGLELDFADDNQGSDLVTFIYLENGQYRSVDQTALIGLFDTRR